MKQHTTPILISKSKTVCLDRVDLQKSQYDEAWLQAICYENQNLLPVNEIEPSFSGHVPICMELNTESGPCDIIYLNEEGMITIAECKLWRNPEARRKAVGQVLDYAKDIARWSYAKFEQRCLDARKETDMTLYQIMQTYFADLIESEFIDKVQKNLSNGRFLLLIIGDGIRENMEDLVAYIQANSGLSFCLSLVEIPVYKNSENNDLLLTPRILVKTKEIEHTVVKFSDTPLPPVSPQPPATISEKVFYERLTQNTNANTSGQLREFIKVLNEKLRIVPTVGRGKRLSLNLKSGDGPYNFASVQENGEVWFYGIVNKTEERGDKSIGIKYLKKLAEIVGGIFDDSCNQWYWCVKKDSNYVMIDEYLKKKQPWQELIDDTLKKIQELEQKTE
jgi:hypothetical protein